MESKSTSEKYKSIINSLKRYRYTKKRLEILYKIKRDVDEYKKRDIKNIYIDGFTFHSSKCDIIGDLVKKTDDMEKAVNNEIEQCRQELFFIDAAISVLSEVEKDIIEMKYIDKIPSKLIEDSLGYERTQINRKKNDALKKMYDIVSL